MARPSPLPSVLALARSKRAVRRSTVSRGTTGPSFATSSWPSDVRVTSTGAFSAPWRSAFSKRFRRRIPKASGSMSDMTGASGNVSAMRPGASTRPTSSTMTRATARRICATHQRRSRPPSALASCMRRFGESRQAFQRGLDLYGRASAAGGHGSPTADAAPARWRRRAGFRGSCAAFAAEAPLRLRRLTQPSQQAVQRRGQRATLRRKVSTRTADRSRALPALPGVRGTGARDQAEANGQEIAASVTGRTIRAAAGRGPARSPARPPHDGRAARPR